MIRTTPRQRVFFEGARSQMTDSISFALAALAAHAGRHWVVAYSGGKDSSALLSFVVWAIVTGRVPAPASLRVLYADTRMELLPLQECARGMLDETRERGFAAESVLPLLDDRFYVYMFGRGVPPPNNARMRWCTPRMKVLPMASALVRAAVALGFGAVGADGAYAGALRPGPDGPRAEKFVLLTGVRRGESAARDGRIALACGRDGGECGQGWFHETTPTAVADTLAPLLTWRTCHVWEWLDGWAVKPEFGGWDTQLLARAYGGRDGDEPPSGRMGCVGCPLVEEDRALAVVVAQPLWAYLAPLQELHGLYRGLRHPSKRLRKPRAEVLKSGKTGKNPQRLGPLTMDARREGLARVLDIQARVNAAALALGRPTLDLLNAEEVARIEALIAANTWPRKWTGREPRGDVMLPVVGRHGQVQPLLSVFRTPESDAAEDFEDDALEDDDGDGDGLDRALALALGQPLPPPAPAAP